MEQETLTDIEYSSPKRAMKGASAGGAFLLISVLSAGPAVIDWERYMESRRSFLWCKAEHIFRMIGFQF